jgi:hypothetical protein
LGDAETEHQKFTVDPWRTPEKVLTGHLCDQMGDFTGNPRAPAAPATRDPYRQSVDRPSRRKSVSGFTMIRLSRHWDHQRENKIQNRDPIHGSKDDEYGCAPARQLDGAARSIPATA